MMVAPLVCKPVRLKMAEYMLLADLIVLKLEDEIDMNLGIDYWTSIRN